MDVELKPCPFCGKPARLSYGSDYGDDAESALASMKRAFVGGDDG